MGRHSSGSGMMYKFPDSSSRYSGKRNRSSFPFFSVILILLVLGGLSFGAWKLFCSLKSANTSKVDPEQTQVVNSDPAAAAANREKIQRQEELSENRRYYNQAVVAWKAEKYDVARDLIRSFLLTMDVNDPLFDQCRLLLNRCSEALYLGQGFSGNLVEYSVVRGDSLSRIAKKFGTSVAAIQQVNGMAPNDTRLQIGQVLQVYSSDWLAVLEKERELLLLYDAGKLFKVYRVTVGTMITDRMSGKYKIGKKEKNPAWKENGKTYPAGNQNNILGTCWIGLQPVDNNTEFAATGLHGNNVNLSRTDHDVTAKGYFLLNNDDIDNVYLLLPVGTQIHVK